MSPRVEKGSRIFRKFDQQSIAALHRSVEQAALLGDAYVGIEHIFLAILTHPDGNDVQTRLTTLHVNQPRLQSRLLLEMEFVKRESEVVGITEGAKRVIEIAAEKPLRRGIITSIDMTRAILFDGESKAAKVLAEARVTLDTL